MKAIASKLDETRRLVKLRDAASVGLALATFAGVFLAVEVALDRHFMLDRSFRSGALYAFTALGAALVLLGLGLGFRRISLLYAARVLERHQPGLRQSLTTCVQMRLGEASGSEEALEMIESRLALDLGKVDFGAAVRRRLGRLVAASALILLLFVGGAAAVAGSGFFVCVDRVVRPGAGIAPPTETRIVKVEPGDRHILQSADLEIVAHMSGVTPPDARIYLGREEGAWFTVAMRADKDVWRATLPGGQESYRYFIAAGDTRSDIYRVTVHPPPVMTNVTARVGLPSYARPAPRQVAGGDLELLPQSSVILTGVPNRKLKSADIVFDRGARVPFKLAGTGKAQAGFTAVDSGSYFLDLVDEHGLRHPRPQRYSIEIRPDRPPEVEIVQPAPVAESIPDEPVEILVNLSDDYGIDLVELVTRRRGAEERRMTLTVDPALGSRQRFTLKPSDFKVEAPGSLLYYIEARDNAPGPQSGRSAVHVLHVRRRPLDALAAFDDLQKALGAIGSDPGLRRKLGLEPAEEPRAAASDPETVRRDRELAKLQAAIARAARDLATPELADLSRVREDLKSLSRELAALRDATQDLETRGVDRREMLARRLAAATRDLQRRALAAAARLDRIVKEKDSYADHARLLAEAKEQAETAAQALEAAARSVQEGNSQPSADLDEVARRLVENALKAVDEVMSAELSAAALEKADDLAREQKRVRELTEELAERSKEADRARRRQAADAMSRAQRALEQGKPGAAQDAAEEAEDRLDPEPPKDPEDEAAREPSDEKRASLVEFLNSAKEEQDRLNESTKEMDLLASKGALKAADAGRLREIGRRERALAGKFREARAEIERELANVFLWVMDSIHHDLGEIGDLIEINARTDGEVRAWQAEISRRIRDLVEALQTKPRGGGGGGGGGGRPPQVNLEAQLKLIRTVQSGLLARTQSLRAKLADTREPDRADLQRLAALVDQQEELRLQVEKLAAALKEP